MRRAVQAFLDSKPMISGPLEVELRELDPTTDPRSGLEVEVPPMAVLWVEERPLAVRLRDVVALSPSPSEPGLSVLVEADCVAGASPSSTWPRPASGACSARRRARDCRAESQSSSSRQPHVQVVVVVDEGLHSLRRTGQPGVGAHEIT